MEQKKARKKSRKVEQKRRAAGKNSNWKKGKNGGGRGLEGMHARGRNKSRGDQKHRRSQGREVSKR